MVELLGQQRDGEKIQTIVTVIEVLICISWMISDVKHFSYVY